MNIILNINDFDNRYINIMEPTKNVIMGNGYFSRCLYSNELLTLNSVYIYFEVNNCVVEKTFNKYKTTCNFNDNKDLLHKLYTIENDFSSLANFPIKVSKIVPFVE